MDGSGNSFSDVGRFCLPAVATHKRCRRGEAAKFIDKRAPFREGAPIARRDSSSAPTRRVGRQRMRVISRNDSINRTTFPLTQNLSPMGRGACGWTEWCSPVCADPIRAPLPTGDEAGRAFARTGEGAFTSPTHRVGLQRLSVPVGEL